MPTKKEFTDLALNLISRNRNGEEKNKLTKEIINLARKIIKENINGDKYGYFFIKHKEEEYNSSLSGKIVLPFAIFNKKYDVMDIVEKISEILYDKTMKFLPEKEGVLIIYEDLTNLENIKEMCDRLSTLKDELNIGEKNKYVYYKPDIYTYFDGVPGITKNIFNLNFKSKSIYKYNLSNKNDNTITEESLNNFKQNLNDFYEENKNNEEILSNLLKIKIDDILWYKEQSVSSFDKEIEEETKIINKLVEPQKENIDNILENNQETNSFSNENLEDEIKIKKTDEVKTQKDNLISKLLRKIFSIIFNK